MRMNHKEVGALLVTFYVLSYVVISVPLGIWIAGTYLNWTLPWCNTEHVFDPDEPRIELFICEITGH